MATQTMKHATIRKASLFKQPPNKRISIKQLNMKMALLVINGLAFIIMTFFLHSHKTQHQQSQQATLQAQAQQQQQQSSSSSTPFTTDSTSSVNTNKRKIPPLHILQQQLERLSIPYYVHSDPRIAQPNITDNLVQNRGRGRLKERFRPEALLEHAVLEAIERHPMRTYDVTRAQLFIIPLRVGANVIHRGHHLPQVVETLAQHSHWNYGHGHVLVALNSATFSYEHRTDVARHGLTKRIYEFFANVTVVKSMDDFACAKLTHTHTATTTTTGQQQQQQQQQSMASHHNKNKNDNNDDYRDLFAESVHTMSRYGFSLGLLAEPSLPYIKASYNHTLARSNVVFYRTRVNASFYNSTQYRHAPILLLNNNNNNNNSQQSQQSRLPQPSCVGFDMNATEWLQEFTNSKFCLAIRGDTPHTHALIRAVKVGCIPVVISDHYPMYAPTFASTMGDMTRFSIFIPEHDFLINPEGSIRSLMTTRSTQDIKIKLKELRFAQRVLLYDHPKSLFVQAFMKEALLATQMPPSKYSFV